MSNGPFDVGSIAGRLKAEVPMLRAVGRAADFAAVRSLADFPAPCAYVILAAEKTMSQPTGHAPRGQQIAVRQLVQVTFGVVLAVRNYREQQGSQAADELSEVIAATRRALMGFVPDADGARACELVSGEIQDYSAATALWADVYSTQHSIGNR